MTKYSNPTESGYSLIELLLAMVIIAVLAAIITPVLAKKSQKIRALREENAFVDALQLARMEAMTEGLAVQLCISIDRFTCSAANVSNNWHSGWITTKRNTDGTLHSPMKVQNPLAGRGSLTAKNNLSSITFGRDGFIQEYRSPEVMFTQIGSSIGSNTTHCFTISETGEQKIMPVDLRTGLCA